MRGGTLALTDAAGEKSKVVKKRKKVLAKPPKGFNDTWQDRLTLGNGVTGLLIEFSNIRSTARLGKGTL